MMLFCLMIIFCLSGIGIASPSPAPMDGKRVVEARGADDAGSSGLRISTQRHVNEYAESQTSRLDRSGDLVAHQGSQTARPRRTAGTRRSDSISRPHRDGARNAAQASGSGRRRRTLTETQRIDSDDHHMQRHGAPPPDWAHIDQQHDFSSSVPVYHDFFHQQPEGIASREHWSSHGASSSIYNDPPYGGAGVPDDQAHNRDIPSSSSYRSRGHELDHNVSYFHQGQYPSAAMSSYHEQLAISTEQHEAQQRRTHQGHHQEAPTANAEKERADELDELVWTKRNNTVRTALCETVSKERGLRYEDIRSVLHDKMTLRLARDLRKRNFAVVTRAIDELFPITPQTQLPVWKSGMSREMCETLVHRMHLITGQRVDIIRNVFLRVGLQPDTAVHLLHCDDDHKAAYAMHIGLLPHDSTKDENGIWSKHTDDLPEYPWEYQIPLKQRDRVVYMMIKALKVDRDTAVRVLRNRDIPLGFGKEFLHCDHERRIELLDYVKNYI
ncbi:hypothetical protein CBS101457_003021 [Exobasidium rhododendri]|nr:hypothetical protein CBS101457_003021 [Exobasidium rhododendri]